MIRAMLFMLRWIPEIRRGFMLAAIGKLFEAMIASFSYFILFLVLSDLLQGTATTGKIYVYSAVLVACMVLFWGMIFLNTRLSWPLGTLLATRLRLLIGEHIRKLPLGWFQDGSTGTSLDALVSDEMQMVQMLPDGSFLRLIPVVMVPVIFLFFLPLLDWRLGLLAGAAIPPAIAAFVYAQIAMVRGFKKRSKSLSELTSDVIEYVQGMEAFKAFRQVDQGFERLHESLKRFRETNLNSVVPVIGPVFLFLGCLDLGIPFLLTGATIFYCDGSITLTIFLIFLVIGPRIYDALRLLLVAYCMLRFAEPRIKDMEAIFTQQPLPVSEPEGKPERMDIEFNNVTFRYHEATVLKNVNFTVPEQKITALVGPSGSGKTTVTNLIARFWDVASGTISIGGRDIRTMSQETLLSKLSMVFQDVFLFNDTIYNNIAFGSKNATKEQVISAAKLACCHDFITALPEGYDTIVAERGDSLSGGERQRLSIARAILKDAPIILLDEATAFVDPENESLLHTAIAGLAQSKTLLVIAHRLSTIVSADRIVVLDGKGGVAATGTHETLLEQGGLYKRFWDSRSQAENWKIKSGR